VSIPTNSKEWQAVPAEQLPEAIRRVDPEGQGWEKYIGPEQDRPYPPKEEYTNDPEAKIAVGGIKYDAGKAPIYRGCLSYFPRAMAEVASVSDFGARKYAWNGWQRVDDGVNRYSDALVRHLADEGKGEVLAPDSGLRHAAHVAWNALARLELMLRDEEVPTTDTEGYYVR
jgi:hypothetical protein